MSYKNQTSLEDRINESNRVLSKYPDRIPIIIECTNSELFKLIKKRKFLVPRDIIVLTLIQIIRDKICVESSKSIIMFHENKLLCGQSDLGAMYDSYMHEKKYDGDKFLYITLAYESTFG